MSIVDPGTAVNAFVVGMLEKAFDDLYVCFPCKVTSFNPGSCRAVVQPLARVGNANPAVIQNVPVLGQKCRIKDYEQIIIDDGVERTITMKEHEAIYIPNVKAGDMVVVVCADVEIKNMLSGQFASPNSKRKHSKNDAFIVGVLPWSLLS